MARLAHHKRRKAQQTARKNAHHNGTSHHKGFVRKASGQGHMKNPPKH